MFWSDGCGGEGVKEKKVIKMPYKYETTPRPIPRFPASFSHYMSNRV